MVKKFPVWVDDKRYTIKITPYGKPNPYLKKIYGHAYQVYIVRFYRYLNEKYSCEVNYELTGDPIVNYMAIAKKAMEKFENTLEKEKLQQQENEKFYAWDGRK